MNKLSLAELPILTKAFEQATIVNGQSVVSVHGQLTSSTHEQSTLGSAFEQATIVNGQSVVLVYG